MSQSTVKVSRAVQPSPNWQLHVSSIVISTPVFDTQMSPAVWVCGQAQTATCWPREQLHVTNVRFLQRSLLKTCGGNSRQSWVYVLYVVKDFVACNEVQENIFGKGLNLPAPLDIQWPKCFQLQGGGASPPDPLTRGSAAGPRGPLQGALPQTPAVIGSCCALEVFLNDMRYINPRFTYLLTRRLPPNHWLLPPSMQTILIHVSPLWATYIQDSCTRPYDTQSFVGHGNKTTLGWKCYARAAPSCHIFNLGFVIFPCPTHYPCVIC